MADVVIAEGPILRAILRATYEIWCEGLTQQAYEQYYAAQRALAWGRTNLQRFALVEGLEVLASLKRYQLTASLDGQVMRVLGLGAVFTQPAHRRKGAARELIERILELGADDGVDLALLFSEIGPDYYARLGFETIPTAALALRVREPDRRGAPAMMNRYADDRDLPDIVDMCRTRAQPFRFHLNRDRDFVHYVIARKRILAGLGSPSARAVQFFAAEEGSSAVAYVVLTALPPGRWIVEECGDRDPSGARVGAMLQSLIARDPAEQRPSITAWLPPSFRPPQVEVIDAQPSSEVMMVRALSARAKAALPIRAEDVLYWHGDLF
jgi:GNAT superfamily N-acetyltransferase